MGTATITMCVPKQTRHTQGQGKHTFLTHLVTSGPVALVWFDLIVGTRVGISVRAIREALAAYFARIPVKGNKKQETGINTQAQQVRSPHHSTFDGHNKDNESARMSANAIQQFTIAS